MRRALGLLLLAAPGCAGADRALPDRAAAPKQAPASTVAAALPPSLPPPEAAPAEAPDPVPSASEAVETSSPAAAAAPSVPERPRLTSQGYFTWIWPHPKADGRFLGYVRFGQSVALRSAEIVPGAACPGGFYAIEPRGFVCRDHTVTLDPSPRFRALAEALAPAAGPLPYRYALSNGAPMYNRVPAPGAQGRHERTYGPAGQWRPLIKQLAAHEELAVPDPIAPADPLPSFLADGQQVEQERMGLVRQAIPLGSMLSFTRAFAAEGRTWLLSTDLTVVPADRARAFRPSAFHGVRLGGEAKLPIAWMRKTARPKVRKLGSGAFEATGGTWPARSFVELTGAREERGGERWLETADADPSGGKLYVAESDATVVEARTARPSGVKSGQKWILVRITQGTLVAYEDLTPVYATLISPGAGGVPVKGGDPVRDGTTPTGSYAITFKDRAATMSPEKGDNRSFWIADVPNVEYFDPPFALHAAFWHERFGEPASAGCVNLSPIDAETLFAWTDPQVPDGWAGAAGASAPENGPATIVVVAR
jgi:L,D-transpeptidase-like protein